MFFPRSGPSIAVPAAIQPTWTRVAVDGDKKLAISLDTLKDFLNIPLEDDSYDAEKTAMLGVAQAAIETYCQMTVMRSTWVGAFPDLYDFTRITKRPFQSVSSIQYVDAATGVITTLDPTTYLVSPIQQFCGIVSRGDSLAWPAFATRPDAVRITAVVGWTQDNIPFEVQQAILITTAAVDRARADGGSGGGGARMSIFAMKHPAAMGASSLIPMEAKALLAPYQLKKVVVA